MRGKEDPTSRSPDPRFKRARQSTPHHEGPEEDRSATLSHRVKHHLRRVSSDTLHTPAELTGNRETVDLFARTSGKTGGSSRCAQNLFCPLVLIRYPYLVRPRPWIRRILLIALALSLSTDHISTENETHL